MIKAASLFSQLLKHFPKTEFMHLVSKHNTERNAKGFSCWTQLVSMLFCHIVHMLILSVRSAGGWHAVLEN